MNLQQLRTALVEKSGRYDLIDDSGADEGANFFIQAGSRFLDRHSRLTASKAGTSVISATQGWVSIPDCWAVSQVWASNWNKRWELKLIRNKNAFNGFWATGDPQFYQLSTTRYIPKVIKMKASELKTAASLYDRIDSIGYTSVRVIPNPSSPLQLILEGFFYTEPLENDGDENFWSERFSDTLLKAALYELEVFYRNTEGAKDWLAAIELDLMDAEQMEVERDVLSPGVMELRNGQNP